MPEDFKQTVNLRERMLAAQNGSKENVERKAIPPVAKTLRQSKPSNAEGIDRVYNDSEDEKTDLHKITRPSMKLNIEQLQKQIIIALVLIMIIAGAYWLFFVKGKNQAIVSGDEKTASWYSIKLINGEVYYGEIANTASDPVVLKNVYYNYDQINPATAGTEKKEESASLRLVKRGNEAHGPDGNMEIVRTQVVFMEPLKEDSKVLRAILDYEK
ncbi:MAG: hypothetical protein US83_C0003G0048 [Candidatus Falkowbacteria bacterium GW2011_GWC2_38_22]|uniref:Uncharacterized protein n=1 Tax=Candidatus Falkowbacteria bacterium GW2011_GWE1_38_31 TaxID=1618638 RepID=A0A0G0JUL5_9BACT|nr:MAG: hypothetical protein US73_C0001G0140 [Candidatus Falkowbacteria bacterium GW2011_GWF2_38_1205]KKQ61799.1 MAG: hypothetical protein US83_C0003G0048 [Candidatus Falkowbacteria bacterium GW2011_GWC2_38_22]KKQ64107.1 MAG: hypothetical protein US84_C0002G0139 [Candidatus Falkowbacteria bacterium GW2011_GWF1_38_22]KKQ66543.1 MAG: hypothetical protein US87_C0001G0064 [Candidatus Falkowbacteria bacterium GW2011_GWE2_38_254]KKQ71213.1 MAG: hypothetical protein US91_C0001G0140 [Candidatus Falkowb